MEASHNSMSATKYDDGKPQYALIPAVPLEALAKLFTIGGRKYSPWNWRKGMAWSRIFSAMMRHAWAWMRGERYDQETGQHHMTSVMWCAMVLFEYERLSLGEDDRMLDEKEPQDIDLELSSKLGRAESPPVNHPINICSCGKCTERRRLLFSSPAR